MHRNIEIHTMYKWLVSFKVTAHSKALTSLAIFGDIVVSGSSDSTVKVWEVVTDELKEKQTISTGKRYPLSLALTFLPGTHGNEFRINPYMSPLL